MPETGAALCSHTYLLSGVIKPLRAAAEAWSTGWEVHSRMSGAKVIRTALATGVFEKL